MTEQTQPTDAAMTPCGDCGMPCAPNEYHPYAACLMFKACRNSEVVRANLDAVRGTPAVAGEVVAWLHKHKHSGMVDLSLHRMADNDFNRARWECIPLSAPAEPQPTQAQAGADAVVEEVAKGLRRYGLTLVKTASGYDVLSLRDVAAHGIKGADHA